MSLLGSSTKWCVAAGLGNRGLGGAIPLATGGAFGTGRNNEHPLKPSTPIASAARAFLLKADTGVLSTAKLVDQAIGYACGNLNRRFAERDAPISCRGPRCRQSSLPEIGRRGSVPP